MLVVVWNLYHPYDTVCTYNIIKPYQCETRLFCRNRSVYQLVMLNCWYINYLSFFFIFILFITIIWYAVCLNYIVISSLFSVTADKMSKRKIVYYHIIVINSFDNPFPPFINLIFEHKSVVQLISVSSFYYYYYCYCYIDRGISIEILNRL